MRQSGWPVIKMGYVHSGSLSLLAVLMIIGGQARWQEWLEPLVWSQALIELLFVLIVIMID